jgi:hypothetical protein
LQYTLTKVKTYRYSISAIDTAQEILDRYRDVLNDIHEIVDGLRKRDANLVKHWSI